MKIIAILATLFLTGCGGTFSISPTGIISYTTPEIIKAPIVFEK